MDFVHEMTLDFNTKNAYPEIGAKQFDNGSRILKIHFTENGTSVDVESNLTYTLRIRKPDRHTAMILGVVNTIDNTVNFTLTSQCLSTVGRNYADVQILEPKDNESEESNEEELTPEEELERIKDTLKIKSTVSFIINVMSSPIDEFSDLVSSDDFQFFKDTIDKWERTVAEAQAWANGYAGDKELTSVDNDKKYNTPGSNNNSKYYSQRSEAWAEGTIDAVNISSDDDAYQNNAKYWAIYANAWANGTLPNDDKAEYSDIEGSVTNNNAQYWAEQAMQNGTDQARLAAQNGEAWAIGTRDGNAVGINDPEYEKYSQFWAEYAHGWAEGASAVNNSNIKNNVTGKSAKDYAALASANGEAWLLNTKATVKTMLETAHFYYNSDTGILSILVNSPTQ